LGEGEGRVSALSAEGVEPEDIGAKGVRYIKRSMMQGTSI
jgi:hypothetical protein